MATTGMFEAMGTALGVIAEQAWPDTVTFRRPTVTKSASGGNILDATGNPTSPQSIPCLVRPARGKEIQLASKTVSGSLYTLLIPNAFDEQLVDVDGTCLAQVAARTGGEEGRAYQIHYIDRSYGVCIRIVGSIEE